MIQIFCAFTGLVNFLACLSLAIFLYLRNPAEKINKFFALWSLSVACWSLGYFIWLFTIPYGHSLFWIRFLMAGAILIPTTYLHFTLVFLNSDRQNRTLILACYLFSAVYLVLDLTPFFIAYQEPLYWFRWWPVPGPLYHFYPIYFVLIVVYAHFLLFRRAFRESSAVSRKRYSIVAFGTLIAYAGGSTNFFLWYKIPIPPVFNFLVAGYVAFIAYAIVHYGLWDVRLINVALAKTTIFLLVYAVALGLPLALVLLGRAWLLEQFGNMWWVLPLSFYTGMITIGPFVYLTLQRKAEETLLKDQRRYQQTLLQASRGMTFIKDLRRLLNLTVHRLTHTMGLDYAAVYLLDEERHDYELKALRNRTSEVFTEALQEHACLVKYLVMSKAPIVAEELRFSGSHESHSLAAQVQLEMDGLKAAVIIPSFVRDKLLGFLVLGEKRNRRIYTQDDLNTLATLANQVALAIENCDFIRRAEITQAQLFQAAKMADLGTMASGIVHQINNRLNVVRVGTECCWVTDIPLIREAIRQGNSEAVLNQCKELEASLRKIAQSAARGGDIAQRLLDFSRASEGFQTVAIHEVLENCLRIWECKRDLTVISFKNEVPADLARVNGNFSQIEEVLFNLLDNAYDAIKQKEEAWEQGILPRPEAEEKGAVTVVAAPVERDGKKYVEIRVEDTGIGMTEETRGKLFVPFFTTKATSIKGTGLGLYVIKRMLDAHRAEIAVESVYGQGAVFRVFLPAMEP